MKKPMKKLDVDTDLIRRLADLLVETGLSEIELGEGERRIRVARNGVATLAPPDDSVAPAPVGEPAAPAAEVEEPAGSVTSPMVGTVYVAPEPDALPFINVGDEVSEGQTLFIIEAMKVMNPIRAPRPGKVSRILVSNGDPVEFGEVLVILE
jgi:acetyl-CoA carboxylase biotin carboxyl carrier protein